MNRFFILMTAVLFYTVGHAQTVVNNPYPKTITVTGSAEIKNLGYWYVLMPVLTGTLMLLAIALVFNNVTSKRHYPNHKKFHALKMRFHSHFKKR